MASEGDAAAKQKPDTTDLAIMRTVLAMDRTLLAWLRTGLTLIGFGFTLAKFVHELILKGVLHGVQIYPRQFGFALMILGTAALLGGALEYVQGRKRLGTTSGVWPFSLLLTLALSAMASGLIVYLMLEM